ncbi:MAG: GNAT family N-acetyltransferase [Oscillospiraceae bacterium]|nr:GNAT family N-acetyltransferase [Oscillospiraceae bacterium]
MLRFRKIQPSDLDKTDWMQAPLTALLPEGADYLSTHIRNGDTVFVILDDDKLVGLLEMEAETVGERPRCAVVGTTVILPEYRRHGLGRILMGLAAGEALERQIWFLAGAVPQTAEAEGFADGIHMKKTEWFEELRVLDLSDVEGLRYG